MKLNTRIEKGSKIDCLQDSDGGIGVVVFLESRAVDAQQARTHASQEVWAGSLS